MPFSKFPLALRVPPSHFSTSPVRADTSQTKEAQQHPRVGRTMGFTVCPVCPPAGHIAAPHPNHQPPGKDPRFILGSG
jgi:hypothetical protein